MRQSALCVAAALVTAENILWTVVETAVSATATPGAGELPEGSETLMAALTLSRYLARTTVESPSVSGRDDGAIPHVTPL